LRCGEFINHIVGDRFFRFVNDQDIVPRLPSADHHIGRRIFFNNDGEIEELADDPTLEAIVDQSQSRSVQEPDTMSLSEFETLQMKLHAEDARHALSPTAVEEGLIGSFIPGASDHSIKEYIRLIGQQQRSV
jgi:hypothetical protein